MLRLATCCFFLPRLPFCLRPLTLATALALMLPWVLGPPGTLGFFLFPPVFPKHKGHHPDLTKTTPELIRSRGYPVEVHHVVTLDGYVLELHRIPGPRLGHAPSPSGVHQHHPGGGHPNHRQRTKRRRRRRRAEDGVGGDPETKGAPGRGEDGTLGCSGGGEEDNGPCAAATERKEERKETRKDDLHRGVRTSKMKTDVGRTAAGGKQKKGDEEGGGDNLSQRVRQRKVATRIRNMSSVLQNNTWDSDVLHPGEDEKRNRGNDTATTYQWKNTTSSEEESFQSYHPNSTNPTGNGGSARRRTTRSAGRRVVLLQHCIFCSSADFVMNDPDQALAFLLADRGYDVWLGNFRGNTYSRKHTRMSTESQEFWRFSWNEMGMFDLPATLDYVLDQTAQPDLYYVGHSMGTTAFFVMMHHFPHLNKRIRAMAAMAPVAYVHHQRGPFTKIIKPLLKFTGVLELFNKGELGKRSPFLDSIIGGICNSMTSARSICVNLLFTIAGPNSEFVDKDYLPVILAHTPDGTSLRSVTHYAQLNDAKRFGAFDYGPAENRRQYGSPSPPQYSLARVQAPVALFWSLNDWVADYQDSIQVSRELGNLVLSHQVTEETFNHMDFLWAEQAHDLVYSHLMRFLDSY